MKLADNLRVALSRAMDEAKRRRHEYLTLEHVLLDLAMFPTVLRSDRAPEFTGSVIAYTNHQLEIRHVLGSPYHPQSQGAR